MHRVNFVRKEYLHLILQIRNKISTIFIHHSVSASIKKEGEKSNESLHLYVNIGANGSKI